VLRDYLIRHTKYEDYDGINRSAYLFSLGKAAILKDDMNRALEYLNQVRSQSRLYPFSLELRGTALAIQGRVEEAADDFRDCQKYAPLVVTEIDAASPRYRSQVNESKDLEARCAADEGRSWYQGEKFEEAEKAYDRIPKASRVWPEILYEQAWTAFAKREFNRTLGKLVTYKAPALDFVFNSEVEVLRAQAYLSLCLYDDTRKAIDDFTSRYTDIGREVKRFVESNASNLETFYQLGARTLKEKRNTKDPVAQLTNRFVRGPYFSDLAAQDSSLDKERGAIASFARMTGANANSGFSAFLTEVLKWRRRRSTSLAELM
jgi:tetratricopeptide (TPR) repeat protein